jgi:hypothetical protein
MFDHARKVGARGLLVAVVAAGAALVSLPAAAQHHGGYHGGFHGGYHGGGWHHGGWGWGVGVGFYDPWWPGYYPGYYPYSYYAEPPVTVIQQAPVVQAPAPVAPATPTYYYCDNPAGYYPYVQQCTQPWRPVAAQPAPAR